ncbi:MAG: Hpt domain-containing protein [Oscillospiraceae bacterium]
MDQLLTELENIGCDVQGALRRFSNNEGMYLKYIRRFPEEKTLPNFCEAFTRGELSAAHDELHTFKGVAGNLGLTELYARASALLPLVGEGSDEAARLAKELCACHARLAAMICANRA